LTAVSSLNAAAIITSSSLCGDDESIDCVNDCRLGDMDEVELEVELDMDARSSASTPKMSLLGAGAAGAVGAAAVKPGAPAPPSFKSYPNLD